MFKRMVFALVTGLLLISCATVVAKQPVSVEQIEGFKGLDTPGKIVVSQVSASLLARQHRGPVLSLAKVPGANVFFSAGKDGFISSHNTNGADETWQISDIPLKIIAVHPNGNLIAAYESDGFSIHRISVWDWSTKKRVYAKRFRDSIISLSWSAHGKYLMIGNTSIEGITVLDGNSGNVQSLFKTAPGIVSLSITGASETSMITFGPSGRIRYTDLSTQNEKASYAGPGDIVGPVLLNNNLNIAGFKDDAVLVLDATSGKALSFYPARIPVMATQENDAQPVWLEKNEADEWILRRGPVSTVGFVIPDKSNVTSALGMGDQIILGTDSGMIYSMQGKNDASTVTALLSYVDASSLGIDDIVSDGSRLFLLSNGSVFISSGPGKAPVFAFDGLGANRFAVMNNSLICWSTNQTLPVITVSFDGETRTIIYQPKEGVRSLSISGSLIAMIEGNSFATVIDTTSAKVPFSYSGAGLQDALLFSQDRMVVSKSSTLRSPYPLILINTRTGETVPLPVSGELCFGIRQSANEREINGFLVKANSSSSTSLVTITLDPQSISSVAVKTEALYADEDLVATVLADGDKLITNLGKNALVEIQTKNGTQTVFERGYSLPLKAAIMDQFLASLNYDGSLTWFDRNSGALIASASITGTGAWKEQ